MVVNTNIILDEGKYKYVAESKMITEIKKIDNLVRISQKEFIKGVPLWDSDEEDYIEVEEMLNPDYKRPTPSIQKWINADYYKTDTDRPWEYLCSTEQTRSNKLKILEDPNLKKSIYGFLGIIPFNPCVMINISPNWKGKVNPRDEGYQKLLAGTIQTYFNACNRYSKYRYCIECGGDGDFLHAHIVAEINPDLHKSVKTHINKGNHKYELIKAWKKLKGDEGLLKGKFAIQRILINNENMRDDKLAYLEEKNKPDGHKNAYDLDIVLGDF